MKKILITLMCLVMTIMFLQAKTNTTTAVFTLNPVMTCQNCENKVKTNIRFVKGVTDIVTDLKAQTVTVTYDPAKTSPEKIVEAFKGIGYTATIATPEAQKPACCGENNNAAGGCSGQCGGCKH